MISKWENLQIFSNIFPLTAYAHSHLISYYSYYFLFLSSLNNNNKKKSIGPTFASFFIQKTKK